MKSTLIGSVLLVLTVFVAVSQTANQYNATQAKVFEAKEKILVEHGRMPVDFGNTFRVLGVYGWRRGPTGLFGAYTFSEEAFQQADRSWFIHAMMKEGSDLLIAVNRNVKFDRSNSSWILGCTGCTEEYLKKENAKTAMTGYLPPVSPVGYMVGFMYKGPEGATVVEVVNRTTLRLDKKSPGDVLSYDVQITPPDYRNMCECEISQSSESLQRLILK